MQSSKDQFGHHGLIAIVCLLGALVVQTAMANCPPGYRAKAGHCIPVPTQPHRPYVTRSNQHVPFGISPVHAKPHTTTPKMIDKSKVKSQPGTPIEHHASASNTHGIIFVGGKNAINSQPVPPGKSSLNPQPIPPGRTLRAIPHPGAPIEKAAGHRQPRKTTP